MWITICYGCVYQFKYHMSSKKYFRLLLPVISYQKLFIIHLPKLMSRYIFTILLLLSILAQAFRTRIILLDYHLQTESYIKNCINKKLPTLECKGKCQLAKKLQQAKDQDQKKPALKIDQQNVVISSKSFFASIPYHAHEDLKSFNSPSSCTISSVNPKSIFHPPGLQ